jgi:T-complex protein 1 subunit eta
MGRLEGTDTSQGTPQLLSNISACLAVAQTVATTLGPRGMDKLIVDERGQATISSASNALCEAPALSHTLQTTERPS